MNKYTTTVVVAIVIIAGISAYFINSLNQRPEYNFVTVKQADIAAGVIENGVVKSAQDLSLSFQTAGSVAEVDTSVGQSVKKGQVLMKLNNQSASASVNQASAAVSAAQANYDKVVNGATGDQLDVAQSAVTSAQTALDNAKKNYTSTSQQQALLVKNAQTTVLNTGLAATPATGNLSSVVPIISGAFSGSNTGQYQITLYNAGDGEHFNYSGLETGTGQVNQNPQALGTLGLFIQFPSTPSNSSDSWTVSIPNAKASSYVANENAYNAAVATQTQALVTAQSAVDAAQSALDQAQSSLQLMSSTARPEDISAARAQESNALAMLQSAQSNYQNSIITAPIDGIITSVDGKVGQQASPGQEVIELISQAQYQIEAYVSETDLAEITVGDDATITLDTYGSSAPFDATVVAIDPSTTTVGGIASYKVTLQFDQNDPRIKEGMTANITINHKQQQNGIVIPASSVFHDTSGSFVLMKNSSGGISKQSVSVGITNPDNTSVAITDGLKEGDQIVSLGQ